MHGGKRPGAGRPKGTRLRSGSSAKPPTETLRPKHARFVQEYLVDLNATQAAIRAGYSAKTADREGYRLLRNAEISAAVQAGQQARLQEAGLTATRVLEELRRVGFMNIRGLFEADGRLKPVTEWSEEHLAAVASVDIVTVAREDAPPAQVHELRLWNKVAALDTLAKHFGLLKERLEVEGPASIQIVMQQIE